ncbi:MAG TPA: thiamine pyrophosphate-dependent enzyme [Candidatus Acidoferrales bacterium]|nr:thiamine pyrophosphate-dependent enzyme [Candidatus Acidoferrales bacterium]
MADTVSDILVNRLIEWGVDTIFGLPGDGINGVFEALRQRQDKLRFVQVRHEEAAAFAACGYAKFTGRLGVCIATSGPGGVHLLNGLYDAKFDRQPVLAITGHTFHDLIGTFYQQDLDLDKLFMDVAFYNQRVMGPAHVENVLDEAIKTALAYRGVAHITIPKDIQEWKASDKRRSKTNVKRHSADVLPAVYPIPPEAEFEAAARLIAEGSKIAILAGRGALGAREQVLNLARKLKAPVVKALLGKAAVPDDDPHCLGGIGLLGTAPSQDAMQECDTLIMAGTSFPYMDFLPKPGQAKIVQVDIDPTRIGLRADVDVGLVGDCATVLDLLAKFLPEKQDSSFLEKSQRRMQSWNKLMDERGTRHDMPMKPQVVTHELNKLLNDDAIVIADSGTIATWAARYISIRGGMQFSLSGMLATMANGLPYGIGASVAYPGRQVVCIVGDGGLTMLMGEIATLVKYKLPVKVVVIKNNELGQIKWEQMALDANPEFGTDLQPIDFALHAQACGAAGFTVDEPSRAAATLRQALEHPGPAVIQAVVDPKEPPLPGNVSLDQAVHFAEALVRGQKDGREILKTVVENKVREVI